MIVLGITGGIGSGKSRVLNELETSYGAYILETDKLAHKLMEPGEVIYNRVVETFGNDILYAEKPHAIDRKKLGQIVFSDAAQLDRLNKIVHPGVKSYIRDDIEAKRAEGNLRLYVIEAALLLQDGYDAICDEIWYVYADREERIRRLIAGRGYTREHCEKVMASQADETYYKTYADFIINNQSDFENSSEQLKARLNILLENDIIC